MAAEEAEAVVVAKVVAEEAEEEEAWGRWACSLGRGVRWSRERRPFSSSLSSRRLTRPLNWGREEGRRGGRRGRRRRWRRW